MSPAPAPSPTDAHLHLSELLKHEPDCLLRLAERGTRVVSSCHAPEELETVEAALAGVPGLAGRVGFSFGVHPQWPVEDHWGFLEASARDGRFKAIGECGFDFWEGRDDHPWRSTELQERLFLRQAELAHELGLALVVHLRRAAELPFRHAKILARLPAVVFHSWPSPPEEARALLARGVPAFFSFGPPLLQGKRTALRCVAELPLNRLLLETDAPWQTLRGEAFTPSGRLEAVRNAAAATRGMEPTGLEAAVSENFTAAYGF